MQGALVNLELGRGGAGSPESSMHVKDELLTVDPSLPRL